MKNKLRISGPSQLILFIGVFLFTLVSHPIFISAVGVPLILLFMVIEKIPLKMKPIVEGIFFLFLLTIAAIRFYVFLLPEVSPLYKEAFTGRAVGFILCILTWVVVRSTAMSDKNYVVGKVIANVLTLHIVAFYVQLFFFLITREYLDFVQPFTGIESRYGDFMGSLGVIRPTGMMVEPSTYFFVVLTLTILLFLEDGFSKHKRLFVLTIITMYLTFSTAALIIGTLFSIYILYTQKLNLKYYVFAIIGVIALLVLGGSKISEIYDAQLTKTTGRAGDIRLALVEAVVDRDLDNGLTAFGIFAIDDNISEMTRAESGQREASSINDAGVFIYMWALLGFLGIAYFIILSGWQYRISKMHFWLFLILSLTKIKVFGPLFVFYFAYTLSQKHKAQGKLLT